MGKTIHVQYYAILREQRGLSSEHVETEAATPADLYTALRELHGFSLDAGQVRVAINAEFADWLAPLADGDKVVFIPPVAGG